MSLPSTFTRRSFVVLAVTLGTVESSSARVEATTESSSDLQEGYGAYPYGLCAYGD